MKKFSAMSVSGRGMSTKGKIILSVISGILFTAISFYITLPPINPMAPQFWSYLMFVILSFSYPFFFKSAEERNPRRVPKFEFNGRRLNKLTLLITVAPIIILILGSIISSQVFNARKYASVIEVEEAVFAEDMKESDEVTNIALMDSDSARYLGNKTLGKVSHMVSQYVVSDNYTQINYQYTPKKVANLEHADFFKWFANMDKGVPGYVMVDPVF